MQNEVREKYGENGLFASLLTRKFMARIYGWSVNTNFDASIFIDLSVQKLPATNAILREITKRFP